MIEKYCTKCKMNVWFEDGGWNCECTYVNHKNLDLPGAVLPDFWTDQPPNKQINSDRTEEKPDCVGVSTCGGCDPSCPAY